MFPSQPRALDHHRTVFYYYGGEGVLSCLDSVLTIPNESFLTQIFIKGNKKEAVFVVFRPEASWQVLAYPSYSYLSSEGVPFVSIFFLFEGGIKSSHAICPTFSYDRSRYFGAKHIFQNNIVLRETLGTFRMHAILDANVNR